MLQIIEQSIDFNGEHDHFKRNAPILLQYLVLVVVPAKWLHAKSLRQCVPNVT
jgi:hypothetical protein